MSPVRLLAQEASADVEFGSGENLALFAIMAVCLLALLVAFVLVRQVLAADQGTEKMREIARAIQEGSRAYLSRQFRTLAVFVVLLFFLLLLLEADSGSVRIGRSVAFLVGAVFSALAGYTGMQLAVRANVRVAAAADQGGPAQGHADRLPGRRGGRHVRGRAGPARRRRGGLRLPGRRRQRAVRLRLRGGPAGHVHAGRRGHLHQGGRRRRRPGRQGRAVDPRGRPPQRRHHRRQRRRQRRRLRRHGRRPVRVLRGDPGRGHRPRPGRLPRPARPSACCSP